MNNQTIPVLTKEQQVTLRDICLRYKSSMEIPIKTSDDALKKADECKKIRNHEQEAARQKYSSTVAESYEAFELAQEKTPSPWVIRDDYQEEYNKERLKLEEAKSQIRKTCMLKKKAIRKKYEEDSLECHMKYVAERDEFLASIQKEESVPA